MADSTYSLPADLVTGNIPVSPSIAQKYINDAADEIDSVLGSVYSTPLNMAESGPGAMSRPARLLIKRISNWLASGRLMLATSAGGEDDQLHQYALYLVTSATNALMSIARGETLLPGAETESDPDDAGVPGPLISNLDPESNVEAFYDRIFMAPPNLAYMNWEPRRAGG